MTTRRRRDVPFANFSPAKARQVLREGRIGGEELTGPQRRALGARASEQPPRPARRRRSGR